MLFRLSALKQVGGLFAESRCPTADAQYSTVTRTNCWQLVALLQFGVQNHAAETPVLQEPVLARIFLYIEQSSSLEKSRHVRLFVCVHASYVTWLNYIRVLRSTKSSLN